MIPANDTWVPTLGRILMVILFFWSGYTKLTAFGYMTGYAASSGMPLPQVGLIIAIIIEIPVAIAFLLGWQTRLAALILAVYTVIAALFFHTHFSDPQTGVDMQIHFWKNLVIAGGFLQVVAFGPGRWALDRRA